MLLLTGKNLSERHRELNSRVNDAATQGVSFEDVKVQTEKSDVDRIYKIKLANKYRNIEYIIETLKCGDNLYISKALKCAWLGDEEFSNIINPEYLQKNVFPEMSFKTKRKFLTLISMHVNNDRAASFYTYCIKTKLLNIAVKFLLNTTEVFKAEEIKGGNRYNISDEDIISLIGNSFTLANTILAKSANLGAAAYLKNLRYLYSISNEKYLDLVEEYTSKYELTWDEYQRLGLRISKHIIKNHKDRILRHTVLYISLLNKSMLVKCSSPEDVKYYAPRLLPSTHWEFWNEKFYSKYSYLLDILPFQERLQFIKNIFTTRYPNEEFEMDIRFYYADLYKLMSKEERESWALKHVATEKESFGRGKDYLWYKFVSFDKAFVAIKKYILVSTDVDQRSEIVRVLVHSAQSNRELATLFSYFYQRHNNETTQNKGRFVNEVLSNDKYYNFDEDCWNAFNKILHSMGVYDNLNNYVSTKAYKIIAIIYAIILQKELHIALKQHIDDGLYMTRLKQETDKLPKEKAELVYQYIFNVYLDKIGEYDIDKYDDEVKIAVRKYINIILDLMTEYNKPREEIPESIMKFIHLDVKQYDLDETDTSFSQAMLVKDLKNDSSLVVSKMPSVKIALKEDESFRLNKLLRKIRVYFSTDIAIQYMELFKELLESDDTSERTCHVAVYGILQIAKNADKIDFVTKYKPADSKIPHDEIERKLLYIRKAICKYVCLSRPLVPLLLVQKYIVGDYLKFCMPLMQSYAANLQPALLTEFVKFLFQSPASVQKHGIRLAFKCFSIEELKKVITDIWKNTKNVSLRLIIYQAVYARIVKEDDKDLQTELFDTFNNFTFDLREDDDEEFFKIICTTRLPNHILGEHILSAWKALQNLPNKHKFLKFECDLLDNMACNVNFMQQEVIELIVSVMLKQEYIKRNYDNLMDLFNATKWNLMAQYLVYFPDEKVVDRKLRAIQILIKECLRLWNMKDDNAFVIRAFLANIIENIRRSVNLKDRNSCLYGTRLLEQALKDLQEALPLSEIYETVWSLQLSIIVGNVIVAIKHDHDELQIYKESVDMFAIEFTNFLNEYIKLGKYYMSAQSTLSLSFNNIVCSFMSALPHIDRKFVDDTFVVVCSKLVEIQNFSMYYFALDLLPVSYNCDGSLYRSVIHKIKSFDNDEIKFFLYKKLVMDKRYEFTEIAC